MAFMKHIRIGRFISLDVLGSGHVFRITAEVLDLGILVDSDIVNQHVDWPDSLETFVAASRDQN